MYGLHVNRLSTSANFKALEDAQLAAQSLYAISYCPLVNVRPVDPLHPQGPYRVVMDGVEGPHVITKADRDRYGL